jgi:hypothetical protein
MAAAAAAAAAPSTSKAAPKKPSAAKAGPEFNLMCCFCFLELGSHACWFAQILAWLPDCLFFGCLTPLELARLAQ